MAGDLWVIASSFFWALHMLFVGRIAERIAAPFPGRLRTVPGLRTDQSALGRVQRNDHPGRHSPGPGCRSSMPAWSRWPSASPHRWSASAMRSRPTRRSSCRPKPSSPRCSAFLLMGDRLTGQRTGRRLRADSVLHRRRPDRTADPGWTAGPGKQTITRRLKSGFRRLARSSGSMPWPSMVVPLNTPCSAGIGFGCQTPPTCAGASGCSCQTGSRPDPPPVLRSCCADRAPG
jgi:hypothetical protein